MNNSDISRRSFMKQAGVAALAGSSLLNMLSCQPSGKKLPNVVLIFIDDQGYADVGCFGAEGFETPHIDRLAVEGMRFTNFYVSQAVCSASRAALLTGCYSERVGIQGALSPWAQNGLSPEEDTIADILKQKGYKTAAVGKWHLGHLEEFLPQNNGFDEYFGLPYSNDMWPVGFDGVPLEEAWKSKYPPLPLIDGVETVDTIETLEDQATLTTRYTDRAVQFIEKNKNEPFFLYLAHSMVHVPLGVSEKFRGKSEQGMYGDVVMEVDWSVGQVMSKLEKHGLDDNTLVIYTSDNGPWLNFGNHAGSARPLREGKGTAFEGGMRVPTVMRWPGHIPAGTECTKLASTIDILPTLATITGANLPEKKIDGVNIRPLMKGDSEMNPRDVFYCYYGAELRAIRWKQWKLYFPHKSRSYVGVEPGMDGYPGPYATLHMTEALYNLDEDIGETTDMAASHPDIVTKLKAIADQARQELGDRLTETQGSEVRDSGRSRSVPKHVKHLAVGAPVTLAKPFNRQYRGGSDDALTDGKRGSRDFADGLWQGFEVDDLDATIDLGKPTEISMIKTGFLDSQFSWIFPPTKVEFYAAGVSKKFEHIETLTPGEPDFNPNPETKDFAVEFKPRTVRYVRVKAANIKQCPEWHSGKGGKAWLFADEVIIQNKK